MTASRIANVTAALWTGPAAGAAAGPAAGGAEREGGIGQALGGLCRALFEEVIEIGAAGPATHGARGASARGALGDRLAGLAAAFTAASGERVLVVDAKASGEAAAQAVSAEVPLALVAWPERSALQLVDADGADLPFAIYRRDACLARIRALEGALAGSADRTALEGGLEAARDAALGLERISLAALGLAEGGRPGGSPRGPRDGLRGREEG